MACGSSERLPLVSTTATLHVTKGHGTQNDFVLLDDRAGVVDLSAELPRMVDAYYRSDDPKELARLAGVITWLLRSRIVRPLAAAAQESAPEPAQPSPADRRHFNQYKADHARMKADAGVQPPFEDESNL